MCFNYGPLKPSICRKFLVAALHGSRDFTAVSVVAGERIDYDQNIHKKKLTPTRVEGLMTRSF